MKEKTKKLILASGLGLLTLGAGVLSGASLFPRTITEEVEIIKEIPVEKEVIKEVEVPVEKEVIVEVDNENLDMVLEYMLDENVSMVTQDLSDDDLDVVVDRIVFLNEAEAVIKNFLTNNVKEELVDTVWNVEDEDKISIVFIQKPELIDVDFDTYEDFGYVSAVGKSRVFYTYDDGGVRHADFLVEVWNDKARFI